MRACLIGLIAAVTAAIPASAHAQVQQQDATVATGMVTAPSAPNAEVPPTPLPYGIATIRTLTYQPICELRREQFADVYGWRVRDVRVCY